MSGEALLLKPPFLGVISEEFLKGLRNLMRFNGEGADGELLKEVNISLLLTGHNVMHEHGTAGCDRLVNGGASSFANDEVMSA